MLTKVVVLMEFLRYLPYAGKSVVVLSSWADKIRSSILSYPGLCLDTKSYHGGTDFHVINGPSRGKPCMWP